jgi:hypothetical protein
MNCEDLGLEDLPCETSIEYKHQASILFTPAVKGATRRVDSVLCIVK